MKRPICVRCQTEFQQIKSGVSVIDMFSQPPKPYQIWLADLFECPTCKTRIVSGFAQDSLSKHFNKDFGYWLEIHSDGFQIFNYEHPTDAVIQRLIGAISRHEPMANDPAIIDAINAIDDALHQKEAADGNTQCDKTGS